MSRHASGTTRRLAIAAAFAAASLAVAPPARAGSAGAAFAAKPAVAADALGRHPLRMLDGPPTTLAAMRGDVVVVNFWATWCAPCRKELPRLDALNRQLAGHGARIVAVSIDEDAANVERFTKGGRLTLPVAHDGPAGLARELDLRSVPATIVLDRDGRVAWSTGRSDEATLAEMTAVVKRLAGSAAVAGGAPSEGGAR